VCIIVFIHVGDIAKSDYNLSFSYDRNKLHTLHFYWSLSRKTENMMDSQFISGFQVSIKQLADGDNITTYLMTTRNLTVNMTLQPNQWYLLIGKILTEDNDTWGPELIYEHFQTAGAGNAFRCCIYHC